MYQRTQAHDHVHDRDHYTCRLQTDIQRQAHASDHQMPNNSDKTSHCLTAATRSRRQHRRVSLLSSLSREFSWIVCIVRPGHSESCNLEPHLGKMFQLIWEIMTTAEKNECAIITNTSPYNIIISAINYWISCICYSAEGHQQNPNRGIPVSICRQITLEEEA